MLLIVLVFGMSVEIASKLFESMKCPRYISAPMVDQSSLPWRLFVRKYGADVAYTQMLHAKHFAIGGKYRRGCMDWLTPSYSNGREILTDRPLIAQLAGDDADTLISAGKHLENEVTAIDLNLGCPQKIAKRGRYGAYLLPDVKLVQSILTRMVNELKCPITAKIRIFSSLEDTLALCRMVESCGVQLLTVHARTVEQNKQFTGEANWDFIKHIKNEVQIPGICDYLCMR